MQTQLPETNNIFNKFNAHNITTNKGYMGYSYGISKTYYNYQTKQEQKKKKNSLITKYSAYFVTGIAVLAAIGLVLTNISKNQNLISNSNNKLENTANKLTTITGNFSNIRNNGLEAVTEKVEKVPILGVFKKISNKLAQLYKNVIKKTLRSNYDKLYNEYLAKGGDAKLVQNFDNWFNSIDANINEILHTKGNRVIDEVKKEGFIKRFFNIHIANSKINQVYVDTLRQTNITQQTQLSEIIQKLDTEKIKIGNTLIPKLRDINCGSPTTDILGLLASIIGLGSAIKHTEDKEDKKSIIINLGLPILTSLAITTYATLKCLTGSTSLLIGMAMGGVTSNLARYIDKKITKNAQKNAS